jgi:hypothetical protein
MENMDNIFIFLVINVTFFIFIVGFAEVDLLVTVTLCAIFLLIGIYIGASFNINKRTLALKGNIFAIILKLIFGAFFSLMVVYFYFITKYFFAYKEFRISEKTNNVNGNIDNNNEFNFEVFNGLLEVDNELVNNIVMVAGFIITIVGTLLAVVTWIEQSLLKNREKFPEKKYLKY